LKLSELSLKIGTKLHGNPNLAINAVCSLNSPKNNSIAFIKDAKNLKGLNINKFDAILCNEEISHLMPEKLNFLVANDVIEAYAKLALLFKNQNTQLRKIDDKSIFKQITFASHFFVGKNVKIGMNSYFGSNVVIGDNVSIGNNVSLGHNVVLSNDTVVGNDVIIESGSVIGSEGFGNFFSETQQSWQHIPHLGKVVIGNNVSIGANCTIDIGTIDDTFIGDGVIIDNSVHIAHNVCIGEKTAIAAKVGIAGSCSIGKRNMIGGMVGIVDHIKTADDVVISATSSVTRDIKESGTYTGIMPISNHFAWKRIAFWITKLDKIAKFINLKKS